MQVHENSLAASVNFDYDAVDAAPVGESPQSPQFTQHDLLEFGRRIISYIRSKDRARVTADCIFLALGDAELGNETMTSIARDNGLTKAAISKRTKEVRAQLHLPVTANNKSLHAIQKYRHNRSPLRLKDAS